MSSLGRISAAARQQGDTLPLVLVLDNLRSGLNVGSLFRTADAFLVEKLLLCGITVQPPHREVLKTALGSTESVAWEYFGDVLEAVQALKAQGYAIWAVEQTDTKTWLQDFQPLPEGKYALVLGNEVDGVDEALLPLCDGAIEIPQFGAKHSLNVAVAGGIVVWELAKKLLAEREK
jgi:23S rRNA (guanosine2251-2'-O)-methyltransferase